MALWIVACIASVVLGCVLTWAQAKRSREHHLAELAEMRRHYDRMREIRAGHP